MSGGILELDTLCALFVSWNLGEKHQLAHSKCYLFRMFYVFYQYLLQKSHERWALYFSNSLKSMFKAP